jgi:hypothetical protein
MPVFTPEDLLQFHYGEMPETTKNELRNQLENDWALQQKLSVVEEASKFLDQSLCSPRSKTIDSLMAYAAKGVEEPVK